MGVGAIPPKPWIFNYIEMIEKSELKKKSYYTGTCRNTRIAQWDGVKFIFINYFYKDPYIETIPFFGDVKDKGVDGFIPIKEIIIEYSDIKKARIEQEYKVVRNQIYKNINIKNIPNEVWEPVVGFENLYSVSNMGRVFSHKYNIIMKQNFSRGYLILGLTDKNKKRHTLRVHRLVLMTFKPKKRMGGVEANHINGIRTDNRDINLEWVSHRENSQKMYLNDHYNKKLKSNDVVNIKQLLREGVLPRKEIAKMFNISTSSISEISTNKKWIGIY